MNIAEHGEVTAALRARDAASARRAMQSHVTSAGTILLGHLDQQRFWE